MLHLQVQNIQHVQRLLHIADIMPHGKAHICCKYLLCNVPRLSWGLKCTYGLLVIYEIYFYCFCLLWCVCECSCIMCVSIYWVLLFKFVFVCACDLNDFQLDFFVCLYTTDLCMWIYVFVMFFCFCLCWFRHIFVFSACVCVIVFFFCLC